ncbi:MAG: hypothetical protein ACJA0E_000411 [Bermanella sp.]|jgi:hypothetical protein
MKRILAILAIPFIVTACGSESESQPELETTGFTRSLSLSGDYIASFNMTDVRNASADITVTIIEADGDAPIDTDVTITPLMQMVSGMNHDTPMSSRSGSLDENNQFKTKAYFLMPSGAELGEWSFKVAFDGEEDTFSVDVDMMMSDREVLLGSSDKISSMGNEVGRPYLLYNETRHVTDSMNSFTVYIAARETMMKHTALVDGITLVGEAEMDMSGSMGMSLTSSSMMAMSDYDLMVSSVLVEICAAECDTENNWITASAVADKAGQYKATGLSLAGDETDEVNVRLAVNSEQKMKGDSTEYATFYFSDEASASGSTMHSM